MMEFEKLTWKLQREMRHNRKPIVLFFGNGYDSQLLLMALHKLRKKFKVVHVASEELSRKVQNIFSRLKHEVILLRPHRVDKGFKQFHNDNAFCCEDLNFGFSTKDYFLIAGFNLTEPTLMKAYQRGVFRNLYCPLLRYPDEWITTLYQDMKDTEKLGEFMHDNLTSDSHHNIKIV